MASAQLDSAASARSSRVLAFLVDFFLLTFVTAVIWFVFSIITGVVGAGSMLGAAALSEGGPSSAGTAASMGSMVLVYGLRLVQWAVIAAVLGGFFTYMLKSDGQTLGMSVMDVAVVSEQGTAPTQSQAMKRTAVLLAPLPLMALASVFVPLIGLPIALFMMVAWLAIEAILLFMDDSAQRLGDRIADTFVVEASA